MPAPHGPATLPQARAKSADSLHGPADAIIVLGGGVRRDGALTVVSQARVERALELYHSGLAPRLIMTGKCGAFLHKPVSEAVAMAAFARARNVPDQAILIEEEARDTLRNARFTRERFLAPNRWLRVHIVTSDFHRSRAEALFRAVLGSEYQCALTATSSGYSTTELVLRLLEPAKTGLFHLRKLTL